MYELIEMIHLSCRTIFPFFKYLKVLKNEFNTISTKNKKVDGIVLNGGEVIKANFIVSNVDANQTFSKLLKNVECREKTLVNKLLFSPSLFALYVGTNEDLKTFTNDTCNIWSFDTYEIDSYISNLKESMLMINLPFIMISFPSIHAPDLKNKNKNTIQFFLIAPFESENFWSR